METFLRYWPFVKGIHRSPVNSPHKGQWRGALMFSLICVGTNGLANNRDDGDLRRHHAHYVTNTFINYNNAAVEGLGWITDFIHTLLGMWLFIHAGIKVDIY